MLAELSVPVIISRWLHIAAAIIAVGGLVFLRMVLHPAARTTLDETAHLKLREAVIGRWARVVHVCIAFLILSGIYNAVIMFPRHPGQPLYHSLFGLKVLLALVLFFLAIALTGRSEALAAIRRNSPWWMTVNIILAAAVVLLSNILKNIPAVAAG